MQEEFASSDDFRLAATLLGRPGSDEDQFELVRTHLVGTYTRALGGEADALRDLMSLLTATYTLARSALALVGNRSPQEALDLAADYHAACADECSDE
ncbi:hypothetical protein [Dietzia natronolimnaea]|uniref:hypothetical protein n=1 Tax=Dietzia natronolimnaea TaxID=161920 RepID=UPI0015FD0D43|nr:hypothetical protein [Dietzia natronolimnaea]MBB1036727.1 hypothetical protein [Dietzia natronolimnaea]